MVEGNAIQRKGIHVLDNRCRWLLALLFLSAAGPLCAAISVGSGGSISIGQGAIDLAGGDLQVNGVFDVAAGRVDDAGSVVINGEFSGGSGELTALGDWINNGTFDSGSGLVSLVDDSGATTRMIGDSVFHDLSLTSTAGGTFELESGTVQRIGHSLTILGADGAPVQIAASSPPQIAQMLLEPGGIQNIANVGVSNVHATGEPLAPDQTNQGGTGNDRGWFGNGLQLVPVPTLSLPALASLILLLFAVALLRRGGLS
jgi:hypothetical protein